MPFDGQDALPYVKFVKASENLGQPGNCCRLAPITAAKHDKARPGGAGQGEEARIVKIGGNNGPSLVQGQLHDFGVGRPLHSYVRSMDTIVSLRDKPP